MRTVRFENDRTCPVCGYDLRGSPQMNAGGVRCAECGEMVRAGRVRSRLAFANARGFWRKCSAYPVTVWTICARPRSLGRELRMRVPRRAARIFYWVSIVLATGIGAGAFYAWESLDGRRRAEPIGYEGAWHGPIDALRDSPAELMSLILGVFLAMWGVVGVYRAAMATGLRGIERWRMQRVSLFFTGAVMVQTLLGGCSLVLAGTLHRENWEFHWSGKGAEVVPTLLGVGSVVLGTGALLLYLVSTVGLVMGLRRLKVFRATAMVLAFPLAAVFIGVEIIALTYWVCGFVAMAFWSMSH